MSSLRIELGCALIACMSGCIFDTAGLVPGLPGTDGAPVADGITTSDQQHRPDRSLVDGDGAPPDRALVDKGPKLDKAPPPPDQGPPCSGLSCPLGCYVAQNRCYLLKPTGFSVAGFYNSVTKALGPNAALSFNTDSGEVRSGATVIRSAGGQGTVKGGIYWTFKAQSAGYPELAIFGIKSLVLSAGQTLSIQGTRAFALYARESVEIEGTVSARASGLNPGPGGFSGGANNGAPGAACLGGNGKGGTEAGSGSYQAEAGGGGGGRKAAGGKGGQHSSPATTGGAGGGAFGAVSLAPLVGGCGGGAGGGPDSGNGGYGGGGGGAVQIAAGGKITVTGVIDTAGAGGEGGHNGAGGGGGGSGGAILLEALTLDVSGMLAANGGGGGSGSAGLGSLNAPNGQDGHASTAPAGGGPAQGSYGGAGGAGGARPKEQGDPGGDNWNGGGGGGAAGRIRGNAPTLTIGATNASPTPSTSKTVGKW